MVRNHHAPFLFLLFFATQPDKTLIILETLTSSRKGDLFRFTIGQEAFIDEFAPIIGVQS